ncbi:MAG TPA: hypothetical protein PK490_22165 [Prosthecobacter sp.]|nr:hypothetical protein [Prosthecobacter sp.]HRK17003.1 hypothetical protein [Prosthecobacter sp.]
MKPVDSSDRNDSGAGAGWRAAWLVILVLASVMPCLHWWYDIAGIIERFRNPPGLLPAHWLFFRWTGEMAGCALVFAAFAGFWAWRHPRHRRAAIVIAVIAVLASSVASAMIASWLLTSLIHEEGRHSAEERHNLNTAPAATRN